MDIFASVIAFKLLLEVSLLLNQNNIIRRTSREVVVGFRFVIIINFLDKRRETMSRDFRRIFLPYCLLKHDSGGYVVLNRDYKPLGFSTNDHIIYENYPIEVKFLRMSKVTAKRLSYEGNDSINEIYLYNDATVPTNSDENMKNYLEKLKILAQLGIQDIRKNHWVKLGTVNKGFEGFEFFD